MIAFWFIIPVIIFKKNMINEIIIISFIHLSNRLKCFITLHNKTGNRINSIFFEKFSGSPKGLNFSTLGVKCLWKYDSLTYKYENNNLIQIKAIIRLNVNLKEKPINTL